MVKKYVSTQFVASSHDMDLTIYPRKGTAPGTVEMIKDLKKWAKDNNVPNERRGICPVCPVRPRHGTSGTGGT